jgi:hypothetical protein
MKVYVAMVGTLGEGALPVGVYESLELAMAGLRLYADYNESVFSMSGYYEVYEHELGHILKTRASAQEMLVFGKIKELFEEVQA